MTATSEAHKKFLENVLIDLKSLAHEAKKKYPSLREACDDAIGGIRESGGAAEMRQVRLSARILAALVLGCQTKDAKIVKLCLSTIQRVILQRTVDAAGAAAIADVTWQLMMASSEEIKLLQTVTLLLTTSTVARGNTLAKLLALCFRLCFCHDAAVMNAAGATVRQLVSLVFDRVSAEDTHHPPTQEAPTGSLEALKQSAGSAPPTLFPAASDAYLLFQDLVQLVNGEQPFWLTGLSEMTRTFGLDLIESTIVSFSAVFSSHWEFAFLLKERVCAMVIRLFSPSVKHRGSAAPVSPYSGGGAVGDKPYFPISMRLLRVVAVLVEQYCHMLVMECEIFLSLLVKLLETGRPSWQRAVALDLLHRLCSQPSVIVCLCRNYDMRPHSTKVLQDIVSCLDAYLDSLFHLDAATQGGISLAASGGGGGVGGATTMAAFIHNGVWIPLSVTFSAGTVRSTLLEMSDRVEPPCIPDGYGLSLVYACLLELTRCLRHIHHQQQQQHKEEVPHELVTSCLTTSLSSGTTDPRPSLSPVVGGCEAAERRPDDDDVTTSGSSELCRQLIVSCCDKLLHSFSLLLDASTDETVCERLLAALSWLVSVCGRLHLRDSRDLIVRALCRSALPPHYTLSVLQSSTAAVAAAAPVAAAGLSPPRHHVVVVGTALTTASLTAAAHQGPVMLTSKNLKCMRTLVTVCEKDAAYLDTAWLPLLTTLQHLVWILGLTPSTGGVLQLAACTSAPPPPASTAAAASSQTSVNSPSSSSSSSSSAAATIAASSVISTEPAILTTAVLSDLPALSSALSSVFVGTSALDECALHHVIDSLGRLNNEAIALAQQQPAREPSLFAAAKLLETGLANVARVHVFWRALTAHLLDTCRQSQVRLRDMAADCVSVLTVAALQHHLDHSVTISSTADDDNAAIHAGDTQVDQRLETMLLSPLSELSSMHVADVRDKQLQCCVQLLQVCGDRLTCGWPLLLDVIAAVNDKHSDQLVRVSLRCLQTVITDFLSSMPCSCLSHCVHTAASLGAQQQQLNVSLTAIGLMWNIADYFFQNSKRLAGALSGGSESAETGSSTHCLPHFPNTPLMNASDRLWMCLFTKLGELCVDSRPAVRKSAGQTLFSTLAAHGSLLQDNTWSAVVWQVLFPLLDSVKVASCSASTEKSDDQANILIHHSRNTAHKQWAETQVLTLSGVARVFNCKRQLLRSLPEFLRAWQLLVDYVQTTALCDNEEVALAALKAFQDVLEADASAGQTDGGATDNTARDSVDNDSDHTWQTSWHICWKAWLHIGTGVVKISSGITDSVSACSDASRSVSPAPCLSQTYLTALVSLVPPLLSHIIDRFSVEQFGALCRVLSGCVCVGGGGGDFLPSSSSSTTASVPPPQVSTSGDFSLPACDVTAASPLQQAVLNCLFVVQQRAERCVSVDDDNDMIPALFDQLLTFAEYGWRRPPISAARSAAQVYAFSGSLSVFAEVSLTQAVGLFTRTSQHSCVIEAGTLEKFIKCLNVPLSMKYSCPAQSTWRLAVRSLLHVLRHGLSQLRCFRRPAQQHVWTLLADCLHTFLFSDSEPPDTLSVEQMLADEQLDCAVVELLRSQVLPFSSLLPAPFVVAIMTLLNKGSLHSHPHDLAVVAPVRMRQEFASACFDALLHFSLQQQQKGGSPMTSECDVIGSSPPSSAAPSVTSRLAVTALVHRFHEVLVRFRQDGASVGQCPLPRHRIAEMQFVLKAICSLLISLRSSNNTMIMDPATLNQLAGLYVPLVDCTLLLCDHIARPLHSTLTEFGTFLRATSFPVAASLSSMTSSSSAPSMESSSVAITPVSMATSAQANMH